MISIVIYAVILARSGVFNQSDFQVIKELNESTGFNLNSAKNIVEKLSS
jgi:ribosomal protein L7/L12